MGFSFKYKPVQLKSGNTTRRPLIPLTFIGTKEKEDFMGILDTGSDVTIIPREVAEVLGVKYVGEDEISGLSGNTIKVDQGYFEIIFGKDRKEYQFTIPVYVPKEEGGQIIIGRMGFFEQFRITFCEAERRMIFKKMFPKQAYK